MVLCKKHGGQTGPLCCTHVLEAVSRGDAIAYREVTFDPTDDGECVLQHLICKTCFTEFDLPETCEVDDTVWGDDSKFPWVAPICGDCLREHVEKGLF